MDVTLSSDIKMCLILWANDTYTTSTKLLFMIETSYVVRIINVHFYISITTCASFQCTFDLMFIIYSFIYSIFSNILLMNISLQIIFCIEFDCVRQYRFPFKFDFVQDILFWLKRIICNTCACIIHQKLRMLF